MEHQQEDGLIGRLEAAYGRVLDALALIGCLLLFLMMITICLDVLLRNVELIPGLHGVPASNDLTEYALYLMTLCVAPWLLRQGKHIRVDIVLRAIPRQIAWRCELVADALALLCCLIMAWYSWQATAASIQAGALTIKTLVTPEWWSLIPLPTAFVLLAIEVVFRMHRLAIGPRGPRDDAVSSA
jgi:TRAP-type C4-dicarboxylate transport system permease small subunit